MTRSTRLATPSGGAAPRGLARCARTFLPAFLLAATTGTLRIDAQEELTVLRNARLLGTGDAGTLAAGGNAPAATAGSVEAGYVAFRNGRIERLGPSGEAPPAEHAIDLGGKVVTPGLIDASSSLGLEADGRDAPSNPLLHAQDGFDRYATRAFQEALRNGVTAVHVAPRGRSGIHGVGTLVRLARRDDGTIGEALAKAESLSVNLGSAARAISRARTFTAVGEQFRAALEYREALARYREELAEYEKKLAAGTPSPEKEGAAERSQGNDSDSGRSGSRGSGSRGSGSRGSGSRGSENGGDGARGRRRGARGGAAEGDGEGTPRAPASAGGREGPRKPRNPGRKPELEVLLRALDGDLAVRIEARHSAEILNALDLAAEFHFDLILEGADELNLLGERLPDDLRVVLGGQLAPVPERFGTPGDLPSGVRWTVGSGGDGDGASRFVALNAQLAAAGPGTSPGALELVTARAAEVLGVEEEIGRLAPGLHADLVVWSDNPLSAHATIEAVLVGGRLVYGTLGEELQ
jgi:imidazolonepropionase-like amidohydrolase